MSAFPFRRPPRRAERAEGADLVARVSDHVDHVGPLLAVAVTESRQ